MAVDAIPEEQFDRTGYGRFTGTPTRFDLERFFFLDRADKRLIERLLIGMCPQTIVLGHNRVPVGGLGDERHIQALSSAASTLGRLSAWRASIMAK